MNLNYRLVLEADDNDTILVTSPDFPLVTFGETRAAAIQHASEAAHTLLQSMIDDRDAIPLARSGPIAANELCLSLPLKTQLKVALYEALRAAGLTRADLQRRLGWQRESVDRLFRLDDNSKIEQIDEALRALHKSVGVSLTDLPDQAA